MQSKVIKLDVCEGEKREIDEEKEKGGNERQIICVSGHLLTTGATSGTEGQRRGASWVNEHKLRGVRHTVREPKSTPPFYTNRLLSAPHSR